MKIKNKFRLWWIKHGFGNKVKSAQILVNSLVDDEGWVASPPFKVNTPKEAISKALEMIHEETNALDHVYQKIKYHET